MLLINLIATSQLLTKNVNFSLLDVAEWFCVHYTMPSE
jgi:hypothetical protein